MRVARQQNPAPQPLQRGMLRNALHQPLAQPALAMRLQNKNVAQIRDGRKVADDPRKPDLRIPIINPKAQRVLNGPRHNLTRNPLRPIAIRQESMNHVEIKPRPVGANKKLIAAPFEYVENVR